MPKTRPLIIILLAFIVVGGGIMLAIYLLGGGEGESNDIPTNPDAAVHALADPGPS